MKLAQIDMTPYSILFIGRVVVLCVVYTNYKSDLCDLYKAVLIKAGDKVTYTIKSQQDYRDRPK